jgi:hypothetical protein
MRFNPEDDDVVRAAKRSVFESLSVSCCSKAPHAFSSEDRTTSVKPLLRLSEKKDAYIASMRTVSNNKKLRDVLRTTFKVRRGRLQKSLGSSVRRSLVQLESYGLGEDSDLVPPSGEKLVIRSFFAARLLRVQRSPKLYRQMAADGCSRQHQRGERSLVSLDISSDAQAEAQSLAREREEKASGAFAALSSAFSFILGDASSVSKLDATAITELWDKAMATIASNTEFQEIWASVTSDPVQFEILREGIVYSLEQARDKLTEFLRYMSMALDFIPLKLAKSTVDRATSLVEGLKKLVGDSTLVDGGLKAHIREAVAAITEFSGVVSHKLGTSIDDLTALNATLTDSSAALAKIQLSGPTLTMDNLKDAGKKILDEMKKLVGEFRAKGATFLSSVLAALAEFVPDAFSSDFAKYLTKPHSALSTCMGKLKAIYEEIQKSGVTLFVSKTCKDLCCLFFCP